MLRTMKDMEGYTIGATDGVIGHVRDFYFDDEDWVVRYVVVEAGEWLSRRQVLLSPSSVQEPNWTDKIFPVSLTRSQVGSSPDIDSDKPVSRQYEAEPTRPWGAPSDPGGVSLCDNGVYAAGVLLGSWTYPRCMPGMDDAQTLLAHADTDAYRRAHRHDNPHLRSGLAICKYYARATDGDIGTVQGLLVEDHTWAIRYLIVNTSTWWVGRDVLIAPESIDHIDGAQSTVVIDLTRQSICSSPSSAW